MAEPRSDSMTEETGGGIPSAAEYDAIYDEHCRICGEFGPDAPESEQSFRRLKAAARQRRNYYADLGERLFGRP
jgi:hypothetical protein